ncbi:GntR family transcriptional regulator [Streptomyces sp. WAC05374]|uniref:GntR family transcriptional regulator n=1 Tax=Streptomyces sp. WAC05374 TaxID=2487420 RepID=UPI000F87CBBA|nr:winged helix-turn-helix domain-containing protein [Streptomyces sp. WAC05374]RST19350.1 GntR family transcriptional regulator [Streptomyces sp. WAC05374]TDF47656.1 GntR family transcriptional regulator [Streptomyces sp. WAC05374]TDF48664.1 GntR family transcriptional regulator [Streptomyces sp. WAC05374]TDF59086.1 GntR family transcriptional regulator [Streptomyces sp. WAC05374]
MPEASPRGTYLLIADALRKDIEKGLDGEALPSEAALMRTHDVSRNTIRRALKTLEAEKLIVSAPGVGWRVSSKPIRPLIDRMTDLITEESLTVGDAYPAESKLCERFGASRTAVRRALAQMEGTGLLATVHGKGRTVRALPTSLEET